MRKTIVGTWPSVLRWCYCGLEASNKGAQNTIETGKFSKLTDKPQAMKARAAVLVEIVLIAVILNACATDRTTLQATPEIVRTASTAAYQTPANNAGATAVALPLDSSEARTERDLPSSPGPFSLNDFKSPELIELEEQGYFISELSAFEVTARQGTMSFGRPGKQTVGTALTTSINNGLTNLLYFQYEAQETTKCYPVFATKTQDESRVLAIIDASTLSRTLNWVMEMSADEYGTRVSCLPYAWSDINENGLPDLAVAFLWGNRLAGSELHIFEVSREFEVRNLTKDLPGIVSPWDFSVDESELILWDFDWVKHDCFYPPLVLFRVFAWQGEQYVDITGDSEFYSEFVTSQIQTITSQYGQPLDAYNWMKPITMLLLMHDRVGQRDQGWQLFMEMTDMDNWPGTVAQEVEWLESDLAHFSSQYRAGADFTPNNYCPSSN